MVTVANQLSMPLHVLASGTPNLTDNATYKFRFGPKVTQDSLAVADALAEAGIRTVAIINNSVPFGITGAESAVNALAPKGIVAATLRHGSFQGLQGRTDPPYDMTDDHHGPADTGFFVFIEVAGNGTELVPAAMSKLPAK